MRVSGSGAPWSPGLSYSRRRAHPSLLPIAGTAAAAALLVLLTACGGGSSSQTAEDPGTSPSQSESSSSSDNGDVSCDYPDRPAGGDPQGDPPPSTPDVQGKVALTMKTSIGTLDATLDADKTPCTVELVRVAGQAGLLRQHAVPPTDHGRASGCCSAETRPAPARAGPGYTIPDELSGQETYGPGTLAMANTGQPDSGGSQFFIVYQDTPLPPKYTVFGQVDAAGVKAVQKMAKQGTDNAFAQGDGHPKVTVTMETVTAG